MQSAKPLVSKLCKETEPNSQIAEDDSLSLDTLKKRVSDIELMMLEREHRWFYVYYNTIRHIWSERTRWPVIKSLIAHTLSPTTICATTGGICAITMAFLAYNANDLLKEQNIAVVKQTALIEQQTTLIEKQNVLEVVSKPDC